MYEIKARIGELLRPYPPSFAKSRASTLILDAVTAPDPERPLRFKVFDVIYGFLTLEQKRHGIHRGRDPEGYALFKQQFLYDVCYWVPGKDKIIDGIREAMSVAAKYNDSALNKILNDLGEAAADTTSYEQRRRASNPHPPDAFGRYLRKKLQTDPFMTEPKLWRELEKDAERGGLIVIKIFPDEVEIDDLDAGDFITVKRNAVSKRLLRMKKIINSSR